MSRHKLAVAKMRPDWTSAEKNECLVSVGEEVYTACALAESYGARGYPSCEQLMKAGDKERDVMDDVKKSVRARSLAGERALRKYWSAKSCARRCGGGA